MASPVNPQCLIVVDVQRAFVEGDMAVPAADRVLAAVRTQVASARDAGALVVHLQNDGTAETGDEPHTWGWELALEVREDTVIRKTADSGFDGTDLHDVLQDRGVDAMSVCGLLSEMCVAATVRSALALGYDVVVAHDSHATYPVPPFRSGEPVVPADQAARAAEWSWGDAVAIPETAERITFSAASRSVD